MKIDWKKMDGFIPAIIQDVDTGAILMLGYMNREALAKTRTTKKVWFYSRSKKRLWMKGETSGNTLTVVGLKTDCDGDALLIKAKPVGPTCHTGEQSCFGDEPNTLEKLYATIQDRKKNPKADSYTSKLFASGLDKILLKLAEESLEVVHAAQKQTEKRVVEETSDLLYNLFALLVEKDISLDEIKAELKRRQ